MAALVEQLPPRLYLAASAVAGSFGVNAWSADRVYALQQEVVARLHYESRASAQVNERGSEEHVVEAVPLVAVQTVRVRYRDVGQLPPMNLEDEIDVDG